MMIEIFLIYGLLLLCGWLVWPGSQSEDWKLLRVCAAPLFGFGLAAAILFFNLLISGSIFLMADLLVLIFFSVGIFFKNKKAPVFPIFTKNGFGFMDWFVLMLSIVLFTTCFLKSPYGNGLDVWAIWKLKARFIYSGSWQSLFDPNVDFSHNAYPVLYPLLLCWGWIASGGESIAASFLILAIINVVTAVLLIAASKKMGIKHSWIPALFLVSAPAWTGISSSQYADAIVACYTLGGVVYMYFAVKEGEGRAAFVSGLMFGIGTLVKSEGQMIIFAAAMALLAVLCVERDKRSAMRLFISFLAGASIFLVVTLIFRLRSGAADEMVSWGHFTDLWIRPDKWERLGVVAHAYWREIFEENNWVYHWGVLLGIYFFCAKKFQRKENFFLLLFLLLSQMGYLMVYWMTKLPLQYHLDTSLDRCLLQIFPAAIFFGLSLMEKPKRLTID